MLTRWEKVLLVLSALLAVAAVFVWVTRKRHPVIAGVGYPAHPTTWGEAFKIAFLGTRYPEPIGAGGASFGPPATGGCGTYDIASGIFLPCKNA